MSFSDSECRILKSAMGWLYEHLADRVKVVKLFNPCCQKSVA